MRQLRLSLLLGLLLPLASQAQSVRFQSQAISTRGAGIANATIAVCSQPANTNTQPCSPLATLATSTSTTSGGANPLTADSFGNFFFYAAPGRYTVQIYGPAVSGQFVTADAEVSSTITVSVPQIKQGGTCTVAQIQSFLSANAGGEVDARGCTTISTNITNATGSVNIPLNTTLLLGPSLWTCTITTANTPCFNLAAHGAKLLGAGQGDTTSNSSAAGQTIFQCSACGTTTDMIDIGAATGIFRSVKVDGVKILMASTGRYGIYVIGGWHEGVINDVGIYEAVSDDLHIEGGTGATYRDEISRVLTEKGAGYGIRLQGANELAFLTFIDDEVDSGAVAGLLGGLRIDMPAGSLSTQQVHNMSFINCHFQPGDPGTHTIDGVDMVQAGSGQIFNIGFYNSVFEVNPGAVIGGTAIKLTDTSATGIQAIQCMGCAFSNYTNINNFVAGSNITDYMFNTGPPAGLDYQFSRIIFSGTLGATGQNSLEFNQVGQARTIFYPRSDGSIGVRRFDTTQDIAAFSTANPPDATSGFWPLVDNTFQLGRSNFHWGNTWSSTYSMTNQFATITAPTIAAAGCGGGAASIVSPNGTIAFKINVGTTPGSACTITMPGATTGWNCFATDITTNSTSVFLQKQTGVESTTSVTITNFNDVAVATAFVASDILKVSCHAD